MSLKSVIPLIIFYLCLDIAHQTPFKHFEPQNLTVNNDCDYLIFTQSWPTSVCKDWADSGCLFPEKRNIWTIHGLWPQGISEEYTMYCNTSWLFDPKQVKPIENELEILWKNLKDGTGTYVFWAYEWAKHGTCAAPIEQLNSEYKYFKTSLELQKQYSMTNVLGAANILPSNIEKLTVEQINDAIVTSLGKKPKIVCRNENGIQYLYEVRVCFDLKLSLIHCDEYTKDRVDGVLTNCDVNVSVIYPEQPGQ